MCLCARLNKIIKRKKIEESADPEDPDDDVHLARLVTALKPHLAEPVMTHEFIDEDADLACQDLSDWEKQVCLQKLLINPVRIMEMNQRKKMRKKKKKKGRN